MAKRKVKRVVRKAVPVAKKKCCKLSMFLGALSVAALVLFLITVWPVAMAWVNSVHWAWFLVSAIVLMILKKIAWAKGA